MQRNNEEFDIHHISNLAKIDLNPDEQSTFSEQIKQIINYFSSLQKVDTSSTNEEFTQIQSNKSRDVNLLREDKVTESLPLEKTLENAPSEDSGFFKIKKILDR